MAKKSEPKTLLGITLISQEEKLCYQPFPVQLPQVKIYYRRADDNLRLRLNREHTLDDRTGKLDENKIGEDIIKYGLISWEGVYDSSKQIAPICIDSFKALDKWIQDELIVRITSTKRGLIESPLAG